MENTKISPECLPFETISTIDINNGKVQSMNTSYDRISDTSSEIKELESLIEQLKDKVKLKKEKLSRIESSDLQTKIDIPSGDTYSMKNNSIWVYKDNAPSLKDVQAAFERSERIDCIKPPKPRKIKVPNRNRELNNCHMNSKKDIRMLAKHSKLKEPQFNINSFDEEKECFNNDQWRNYEAENQRLGRFNPKFRWHHVIPKTVESSRVSEKDSDGSDQEDPKYLREPYDPSKPSLLMRHLVSEFDEDDEDDFRHLTTNK